MKQPSTLPNNIVDPHLRTWDFKTRLTFHFIYWIVRLLDATYRYRVFYSEHRDAAAAAHPNGTFAYALWHGNSFVSLISHAWQEISPLCSHSKDGSMVAFICDRVGLTAVRGSSSRGGGEARDRLIKAISLGLNPAITVDGPKGPIHDAKPGIIAIAKAGGVAILPICSLGERNWVLRSWDRLHIAKPFARVAITYGQPIFVPHDAQGYVFETYRLKVNTALNALQEEARSCLDDPTKWNSGKKRILTKQKSNVVQ